MLTTKKWLSYNVGILVKFYFNSFINAFITMHRNNWRKCHLRLSIIILVNVIKKYVKIASSVLKCIKTLIYISCEYNEWSAIL